MTRLSFRFKAPRAGNRRDRQDVEQQAGDMDGRIAIFKIGASEPPRQTNAPQPGPHRERAVAARK